MVGLGSAGKHTGEDRDLLANKMWGMQGVGGGDENKQ